MPKVLNGLSWYFEFCDPSITTREVFDLIQDRFSAIDHFIVGRRKNPAVEGGYCTLAYVRFHWRQKPGLVDLSVRDCSPKIHPVQNLDTALKKFKFAKDIRCRGLNAVELIEQQDTLRKQAARLLIIEDDFDKIVERFPSGFLSWAHLRRQHLKLQLKLKGTTDLRIGVSRWDFPDGRFPN